MATPKQAPSYCAQLAASLQPAADQRHPAGLDAGSGELRDMLAFSAWPDAHGSLPDIE